MSGKRTSCSIINSETQKTPLKRGKAVVYCTNRFQRTLSLFLQMAGKKRMQMDRCSLQIKLYVIMHINVGILSLFCAKSDTL